MNTISIWSVIVASISAFAVSAVWYSPLLFGKEWMSLIGATERDIAEAKASDMTSRYVIQFIFTIVTFIVIAFAVSALNIVTARDGAFLGLLAWAGFALPGSISGILWEKKTMKYAMITSVATLLCWVIGGAIIGGWN